MKTIKLLLTESVDHLGIVGDVVTVRPGHARNYLLPLGLAAQPTEHAVKQLAERRAQVEAEMKQKRAALEALFEKLEGHEVTLERSANEQGILYGGVTPHDVAEVLRTDGFNVDDKSVHIYDAVKRLDSYTVGVHLTGDLKTQIKLWVVSDKPSDQLSDDADSKVNAEAAESEESVSEPEATPASS